MAQFKIEIAEGSHPDHPEYDLLMLASHNKDGIWDWCGTFATKREAQAEMQASVRDIYDLYAEERAERRMMGV